MEEPAVLQDKLGGSWEVVHAGGGGGGGGEHGGKEHTSLASLLKHSCFLCWSSPHRDKENEAGLEMDERVVSKTTEIRELETAVTVESLELKEQQADRQELEETLQKLEKHKEKLIQQIKATRQLCYEESQQILSLQAEEAVKESQVEEYERELARARWRLRKLKEEVKQARRKVEAAGERDLPLQDSIRQSYEEILQEENTLCSLSGSAVTPQSQMEGSSSPGDTTEDEPIPVRPWGRSQSLPAYADLIMGANDPAFCHNLGDTREVDDSGSSSPKMDRSDIDDSLEEPEAERVLPQTQGPVSGLDFYQANPFGHCHGEHDLFNEDLFPKTDSSDGFTSDPFKGSDPFGADMLFPEGSQPADHGSDQGPDQGPDEADRSLSCAENKASTGTQCFESEFPDEDSDIEISYSREDLETAGQEQEQEEQAGFRPIQSSSEELGPVPIRGWRSQGQYSGESDPNGYELDLGMISPPSDIEELSLGSMTGGCEDRLGTAAAAPITSQPQRAPSDLGPREDTHSPVTPAKDSQDYFHQSELKELSFDVSYEPTSLHSSSCDPYGFKLSPEHSSHTLLDPDEDRSPSTTSEPDLAFDPDPSSPPSYDAFASHACDLYGFKLSPEEMNQEVIDFTAPANEATNHTDFENNQEVDYSNQEVVGPSDFDDQLLVDYENQEVVEPMDLNDVKAADTDPSEEENRELLDFKPENQEVLDAFYNSDPVVEYENQEVLEPCRLQDPCFDDTMMMANQEVPDLEQSNQELIDFICVENQEVVVGIGGGHDNHMFHNQEVPDTDPDGNQEVPCKEANNNHQGAVLSHSSNSSDSDGGPELTAAQSRGVSGGGLTEGVNRGGPGLLEGDLGQVFRQGGYVGCPDVADDLEPLQRRAPPSEPVRPVRPVRPPRPSLRAKEKAQGIDLK